MSKAKKDQHTNSGPSAGGAAYTPTIQNKKARFNYVLVEKFEAGIALVGTEVKSLRLGKASLDDAFGRLRGGELFLLGCTINPYEFGTMSNHEPMRIRKLLVHRRELKKIEAKLTQKGYTLVPTKIYFNKRGRAKVEMALATGKTFGDKREKIKDREVKRDMQRAARRWS